MATICSHERGEGGMLQAAAAGKLAFGTTTLCAQLFQLTFNSMLATERASLKSKAAIFVGASRNCAWVRKRTWTIKLTPPKPGKYDRRCSAGGYLAISLVAFARRSQDVLYWRLHRSPAQSKMSRQPWWREAQCGRASSSTHTHVVRAVS